MGCEDEISVTLARLKEHRPVTVVGPGGIGKSREEYECRHAEWIACTAERIVLDATGFLPREIGGWIFDERDEMLAAVDWALEHGDPDVAVRIVAAVGRGVVPWDCTVPGSHVDWRAWSIHQVRETVTGR